MIAAFTRFGRALRRDQRGTSVIELALIIPALVLLCCGAADIGMCYSRQLQLQQAAARAAEFANAAGYGTATTTLLQSEATTAAGGTATAAASIWLECDGTVQSATTTDCTGTTIPARYASVTITETYNWMFEQLIPDWNHTPYSVTLRGYAEVRIQ